MNMKLRTIKTQLSSDPLEVFEGLAGSHENCFLLESLNNADQFVTSNRSYIGVAPTHLYRASGDVLYTDGQAEVAGNPYEALRSKMRFDTGLPDGYVGGLVGYFTHEAIRYNEPSISFDYARQFNDFEFGEYRDGLVFRPGEVPDYIYYDQDRSSLYAAADSRPGPLKIEFVSAAKDTERYTAMINEAIAAIQNGRVFQVVLANKYEYRFDGDLLRLYRELREINPSPFMFFLKFGNVVTMGASPELLVHTSPGGDVALEPLAGAIRRGKSPAEDAALARQLLADEKEVAEHSMLVDLARNDAGRVSQIGSVQIANLMYIKKLSHIQHISSLVTAKLAVDRDAFDALASSCPAGTLSGAPKIEAIKMISELEGYERGPYAGAIGYISYNGGSVLAPNLRSVSAVGEQLFLHSGSGIVYDSKPERERQELGEKKAAMDLAMRPFMQEVRS
jgi:anthranilate synthase component I